MARLGIETGADLREKDIAFLRANFGSMADYLYRAARGIDLRRVRANRERKSVGGERTFGENIAVPEAMREQLGRITDIVWDRIEKSKTRGRTVTLKLRYADFRTITRARSVSGWIEDRALFARLGHELLEDLMPLPQPVRLMGLTLSALERQGNDRDEKDDAQLSLL